METFENLPGIEKKKLILDTLVKYTKDELDGVEETIVVNIIEMTVPTLIDTFINVDKKKVVFSEKSEEKQESKIESINIEIVEKTVKTCFSLKKLFCYKI